MFRKSTAALLVLTSLFGIFAAGCGRKDPAFSQEKKEAMVFRYAEVAEPPTLDPALAQDFTSNSLIQNLFTGLVQFNEKGEVVPGMIERMPDVSADGKVYTFNLRRGVLFTNGREIKAGDFVYSINRALDPTLKSEVALLYLGDIAGARDVLDGKAKTASGLVAKDEYTLEITLEGPRAYFLGKLAYATSLPVPKEEIEKKGAKWTDTLVGNGPFKLERWEHNARIILVANEKYFRGRPALDRVEIPIIESEDIRLAMYENGEVDWVGVPPTNYKRFKSDQVLSKEMVEIPQAAVYYLGLGQGGYEPFKNAKVRQAMNYAIDREKLNQVVWNGTKQPAYGILPPGMPGYNPNLEVLKFDPGKAKALLGEAGYPDPSKMPELTIYSRSGSKTSKQNVEFVQNQLVQNLGMKVKIVELEWGKLLEFVNQKKAPMWFIGWMADYLDPQDFLTILLHSKSQENRTMYNNAEVDRLLNEAEISTDQAKRIGLYQRAEQIIVKDAPWVPLYYNKTSLAVKPYVKGLRFYPMGTMPFDSVTVERLKK